jgi:hypothetical protein
MRRSRTFVAQPFSEGELLSAFPRASLMVVIRKPLSFHAVSFGSDTSSYYLRRMAQLALEIQNNAPHDPLLPATSVITSSFTTALDTVSTCAIIFLPLATRYDI